MTTDDTSAGDSSLPIASLPKTALQAIYHAVTGKTENLARSLTGNVVISSADVDRLYEMLLDQLDIHEKNNRTDGHCRRKAKGRQSCNV
jgi:hypothetical protein